MEVIGKAKRLVYYVRDMSQVLGRSELAIRQLLFKRDWESIPPPFRLGGTLAWKISDVEDFLDQKAAGVSNVDNRYEKVEPVRRRPGRPRKMVS